VPRPGKCGGREQSKRLSSSACISRDVSRRNNPAARAGLPDDANASAAARIKPPSQCRPSYSAARRSSNVEGSGTPDTCVRVAASWIRSANAPPRAGSAVPAGWVRFTRTGWLNLHRRHVCTRYYRRQQRHPEN
jgi:hypothetical protein